MPTGGGLLRENLEESISCMEIAYRAATNSGSTVAALKIYLSGGLVPPEDKESAAGDGHKEMTRAAVLAGLYFPSLSKHVNALAMPLLAVKSYCAK
jgi:hypothetical protein